jgi:prevent-host-death family protein
MYIFVYIFDMGNRYSIAAARANLPAIIGQAEAGEAVEITRRGRAVAVVLSREAFERLSSERPRFGDAYRAFLDRFALDEVGIEDDFALSVRDRSSGRKAKL